MNLHHVALCVSDIRQAVDWYVPTLHAKIAYQDETWALLKIENTSVALVLASQHPPHVAFEAQDAEKYGKLTPHRDGTASVYVQDPFGNTVEFLKFEAS
jgi:catechol 2,3-dioxygenase-like lactoylglutathione lyase family enzyme